MSLVLNKIGEVFQEVSRNAAIHVCYEAYIKSIDYDASFLFTIKNTITARD